MGKEIKERSVNMEALRILSMFLIVLLHSYDSHGGVIEITDRMGGGILDFILDSHMQ